MDKMCNNVRKFSNQRQESWWLLSLWVIQYSNVSPKVTEQCNNFGFVCRCVTNLTLRKGTRYGCGDELSSWYNLLVKSSGSIFASCYKEKKQNKNMMDENTSYINKLWRNFTRRKIKCQPREGKRERSTSRFLTSSLTLAVVSDDCFPLDASLISVDRKFLHFFTFSSVSCKHTQIFSLKYLHNAWKKNIK